MTRQGISNSASTGKEGTGLPPMRNILEHAGFRIRSPNRADCAHCSGSSLRTVGYTPEVAHCFRCGWAANRFGLAKQLGLLQSDPVARAKRRAEVQHRRALESTLRQFENWRDARIRRLSSKYRILGRQALVANEVLQHWPEYQPAWDALARFYHAEPCLLAAIDFLTFAKASNWLERDSTPAEVFEIWRGLDAAA